MNPVNKAVLLHQLYKNLDAAKNFDGIEHTELERFTHLLFDSTKISNAFNYYHYNKTSSSIDALARYIVENYSEDTIKTYLTWF